MAGTRASTKRATTASEPSDGMDSTQAPKGKHITARGKGKGGKVTALKRSLAQGRGGSTTSSPNSSGGGSRSGSTVLSWEDTRKLNELQRIKKKKALANQAKEDAAIQKRTRAMMEAEQDGDEDDGNGENSDHNTSDENNDQDNYTHKCQRVHLEDLDPQKQAYADGFDKDDNTSNPNNTSNPQYSDLPDQAENRHPIFDQDGDEEDNEDNEDIVADNAWNDVEGVFGGGYNNGQITMDEDSDNELGPTPSTPYCPKGSVRQNLTYKIVEDDFSPKTLRLAIKGKNFLRKYIATELPFPPTVPVDLKDKFISSILQEASEGSEALQTCLKRANDQTKILLTTFIWYARGGLLSSIISKARLQVPSLYGIAGQGLSHDDIKCKVSWLLDNGNFKFGGVNWTSDDNTSTVDYREPFGHLAFIELIRDQWFSTSKGTVEAFKVMVSKETIPAPVLILVVCAVEHVLQEYANGKKMQHSFNSEALKIRYSHHLNSWNILEACSKTWAKAKLPKIYKMIIKSTHMEFMLNGNGDGSKDLKGVDFEALEQSAMEAMN